MNNFLKLTIVGGLLMASTAVLAAKANIVVLYDSAELRFRQIDTETTPVCTLKRMVAEKTGLSMKKFDLRKSGTKLKEANMLKDHHIYSGTKLNIKPVSYSSQCT